jgi:hypothetical protein
VIAMLAMAVLQCGAAFASAAVRLRGGTIFEMTAASSYGAGMLGNFERRVARDGRSVTVPAARIGVV